jgi:phosphatidylserine synthase
VGITTPSAALVIIILIYLSIPSIVLYLTIILVSVLMISKISYPRIKGHFAIIAAFIIIITIITGDGYNGAGLYFLLIGVIIYITLGPFYLKAKFSKQKKHSS